MTKKAFLEAALKAGGLTKSIYTSLKQLKHAAGTQYGAVLRISDTPVRATSKKTFKDQQDASLIRRKLYTCETAYNVVLAAADEEKLEELLEGFLSNLERGFYDDGGNWVDVTPVETDWVDEDDCVMKAKMAVQIKVVCKYGIYKDVAAWTSPEGTEMELTTGKDEDGQQ